jgi:hypothetical protein
MAKTLGEELLAEAGGQWIGRTALPTDRTEQLKFINDLTEAKLRIFKDLPMTFIHQQARDLFACALETQEKGNPASPSIERKENDPS